MTNIILILSGWSRCDETVVPFSPPTGSSDPSEKNGGAMSEGSSIPTLNAAKTNGSVDDARSPHIKAVRVKHTAMK